MPSYRYLRDIDPQNQQPEPPKQYTKKEKAKNWWHYNWKWVVAALLLLSIAIYMVADVLSQTKPDVSVGILSPQGLPAELTEKLQAQLSALAPDINGDGKNTADILTFTVQPLDESDADAVPGDPYAQMAGVTQLTTALSSGTTLIFIVEDSEFEKYMQQYGIFETNAAETVLWENCPALAALDLRIENYDGSVLDGQQLMAGYHVGLRRYEDTNLAEEKNGLQQWQAAQQMYQAITSF